MESGAVTPEADEGGNVFANDGKRKGMDDEGRRERERDGGKETGRGER